MFPWENPDRMDMFSVFPNSPDRSSEQREIDRKFRKLIRANRRHDRRQRRREQAIGPRLEQWKWQRFVDGDFSGFKKEFDEVVLIPTGAVLACVVILGMFIVQLDYVDEHWYRRFMIMTLLILGVGVLALRVLLFYAIRTWVSGYGAAYIEDCWILNSSGRIEEVVIFEESDYDE